jgi:hypothetical protein
MGAPSYDAETLAHYFRPLAAETRADPKLAPLLDAIERDDPDLIGAVADVDRSQIFWTLEMTPAERLAHCFGLAAGYEEIRRGLR